MVKMHIRSPQLVVKIHMQLTVAMKLMQCCGIITNNKLNKTLRMVPQARDDV